MVHSLKDLPTAEPAGLSNRTILPRASAADWLLIRREFHAPREDGLLPLKAGTRVGASSLRRGALLGHFAPQALSVPLRGNVPTRLRKLAEGQSVDAIVLAAAGLTRLQLDLSAVRRDRTAARMVGAGAGAGRAGRAVPRRRRRNRNAGGAARRLRPASSATRWEREFLRVIEGGCSTPFGCYVAGNRAHLASPPNAAGPRAASNFREICQKDHNVTHSSAQPSPAANPSSSQKLPLARSAELYARAEALIPGGRVEPGARLPQGRRHAGVLQAKRAARTRSTKTATAISTSAWPGVR